MAKHLIFIKAVVVNGWLCELGGITLLEGIENVQNFLGVEDSCIWTPHIPAQRYSGFKHFSLELKKHC